MPDLEQIIQRMMDAGESDDSIAEVVREFNSKPAAPESGGFPWKTAAAGAGLAGAAALGLRNPAALKAVGRGVLDLRKSSMLSGLALPKSILGAVGEAAGSSIESGSMRPLKEMLSMETLRDFGRTFKAGPNYATAGPGVTPSIINKYNPITRAMGAGDEAAQNAFIRAGYTPEEAARKMLQEPLGRSPLVKSLTHNPAAEVLVPFVRTPVNQFAQGMESIKPANIFRSKGSAARMGTTLVAGGATGATAEDPKTIAMGTAAAGTQGLPFALAAGAARALVTGSARKAGEATQGLSPIPEMGMAQGSRVLLKPTDPASWGFKPSAITTYEYLRKMLGMQN